MLKQIIVLKNINGLILKIILHFVFLIFLIFDLYNLLSLSIIVNHFFLNIHRVGWNYLVFGLYFSLYGSIALK